MRTAPLLALLAGAALAQAAPAPSDVEAQRAHASGSCGSMGPGTGLGADGRGWVVSMLPGPHEFRMAGGGAVGITVARLTRLDLDAGRPYYIAVDGAAGALEWKVPGRDWGPVSTLFLYPPERRAFARGQ